MAGLSVLDWERLQQAAAEVVDSLPPSRPPKAWAIGRAQDAVAVAAALRDAEAPAGGPRQLDRFEVALSLTEDHLTPSFPIRTLDQALLGHIIMASPKSAVDLAAVRKTREAACHPSLGEVAASLRPGARLVVMGRPAGTGRLESEAAAAGLEPVDCDGRVFIKALHAAVDRNLGKKCGPEGPPNEVMTLADCEFQRGLVESHYGLARALARRFAGRGQSREDLEQVAMLALVKAAHRYRPDHQSSFASFATATVLGELKRHFRDKAWGVRTPRSLQERCLLVKAASDELAQAKGGSPSIQQIAAHLELSDEEVIAALDAAANFRPLSLDAPSVQTGETRTEIAVDDDAIERNLAVRDLRDHLAQLTPSERMIIDRVYFQGWTQREVAARLGVSQMQVSRVVARILANLRFAMSPS